MNKNNKFQQPFEIVTQKFLSKIKYGELSVKFPSGSIRTFRGNTGDNIADLTKDDTVLEIGCGWGGFAEYAAKNYKSIITAITISKKQFEFTKQRINNARLRCIANL